MTQNSSQSESTPPGRSLAASPANLAFYGGTSGALLPFLVFVVGVVALAVSGARDERAFWPIQVLALSVGLILARNRTTYCKTLLQGMSQPIVMIMIMAWLLASILGVLMVATGFVETLTWIAGRLELGPAGFAVVCFLICAVVSTSTGTSFGSIMICGPILYPAGALLGTHLPTLAGAILGGATFGDSISPISDTTIASALTQKADIGGTVRSRLKYVIPAAGVALILYFLRASTAGGAVVSKTLEIPGSPKALPMLLMPIVVIALLLAGCHLLHGLLIGLLTGVAVGLSFGLLPLERLFSLDPENFTVRSVIVEGIDRGVGISIFTIFLMGLVAALEASGVLGRMVDSAETSIRSLRSAETGIVGLVGAAALLTSHSIVAILTVGEFTRRTGERFGIHRYRRANLLDLTVVTFPFILPYFIPVILAANTTASGASYGIPPVSPLLVGLHNFYSWAVLAMVIFALISGFGRRFSADA